MIQISVTIGGAAPSSQADIDRAFLLLRGFVSEETRANHAEAPAKKKRVYTKEALATLRAHAADMRARRAAKRVAAAEAPIPPPVAPPAPPMATDRREATAPTNKPSVDAVRADVDAIRTWCAPRGMVFTGPDDLAVVNGKRRGLGLPVFELPPSAGRRVA